MGPMKNCEYHIDENDQITYVNEDWIDFSRENDAEHLSLHEVLGQSLWTNIDNRDTATIYQVILNNVRKKNIEFAIPFRADSPDKKRFMELRISPLENHGVGFNSILLDEEPRSYVTLLDSNIKRKSSFIIICSWCKMVNASREHWIDIEAAVKFLNLFNSEPYPKLSHRICPGCQSRLRTEIINTRKVHTNQDDSLFVV